MTMRYLWAKDPVEDGGADLHYQRFFPHSIDEGIGKKRYFANVEYINPPSVFIIDMKRSCRSMQRSSGCTASSRFESGALSEDGATLMEMKT
jgi:hypothetical protein